MTGTVRFAAVFIRFGQRPYARLTPPGGAGQALHAPDRRQLSHANVGAQTRNARTWRRNALTSLREGGGP